MIDLNKAIATSVKTGKVLFGVQSARHNARTGKTKIIVLAANCPEDIRENIEYYCKLSNIPLIIHKGSSTDLATICDKPFIISALSIREPGDSEILKLMENTELEESHGGNE